MCQPWACLEKRPVGPRSLLLRHAVFMLFMLFSVGASKSALLGCLAFKVQSPDPPLEGASSLSKPPKILSPPATHPILFPLSELRRTQIKRQLLVLCQARASRLRESGVNNSGPHRAELLNTGSELGLNLDSCNQVRPPRSAEL